MTKIVVLNKFDLKKYETDSDNVLLIRITSIYPLLRLKKNYKKELNYYFDDTTEGDNLITNSEAKEIIDEIINNFYEEIIVSCDYGLGRSPAIALAIAEILDLPFNTSKYPSLNKYVYHTLKKVFINEK